MKELRKVIGFVTIATLFHLTSEQSVNEVVGFGQATDSGKEGEDKILKIRVEPNEIDSDISGRVIPLTVFQYNTSYSQRPISNSVQDAINTIMDEAEYEEDGRKDFNNTTINFTITAGSDFFDIQLSDIIEIDGVNEAPEQLILVLVLDDSSEIDLDSHKGVLVLTILDDNPIHILFNISAYNFNETDGTVHNVIKVGKYNSGRRDPPPDAEVEIPIKVEIRGGTAIAGKDNEFGIYDFDVTEYVQTRTFNINDLEVELDPITIVNDIHPESDETFFIYVMKGDQAENLNVFPINDPAILTIIDNNAAEIGFTMTEYVVNEPESSSVVVTVCINVTNGQSLDYGYGSATINIMTSSSSADGDIDYGSTPDPSVLTIQRGQEEMCSNIAIYNDTLIEANETFNVSLSMQNTNFSAGVILRPDSATIKIVDTDGIIAGFAMSNYSGMEGDTVQVCVIVHFPNETIVSMSHFTGDFTITGNSEDVGVPQMSKTLNSNSPVCFDVELRIDDVIEEIETATLSLELTNESGITEVSPSTTTIIIEDNSFAVIGFSQSTYDVSEQSGQDSFVDVCVELISGVIAPGTSVSYSLEYDASATTQESEINSISGTLTDEDRSVCHSVTISENDVVEPDGTIVVRITNSSLEPPTTKLNTSEAVIYVFNDDVLSVSLEASENVISEGNSINISVKYTGNLHSLSTVQVTITTTSGSAKADEDYDTGIPSPHSVSLTNSTSQHTFVVSATNDNMLEDYEESFTISISLDNPNVLVSIDTSVVPITILDDEVLRFSFEEPSYEVSESVQETHYLLVMIENFDSVTIPESVTITISAVVNTATSNATQGSDYTIGVQDLKFDHNTSAGINVSFDTLTDVLVESNEVIEFILSDATIHNLSNTIAVVQEPHEKTVVIITDDDALRIGFTRENISAPEGDEIMVCAKILSGVLGPTPEILLDYIINAPRENLDLPEGRVDSATSSSNSGTNDGDYVKTTERFALSAEYTEHCIQIQLIEDTIVEIDEIFLVQLEQIISSNDLVFKPNPEYLEVTIENNDEIRVGFEMSQYQFSESAGSLLDSVYIVRENMVTVSANFTVTLEIQDRSTASANGIDFSAPAGYIITFAGNDDRQPFPLEIMNDFIGEGNETVELLITTPGNLAGVIPGENDMTSILIIEDDFIPYQYKQPEYSFTENAATTQVCVETVTGDLQFAPGGNLTIEFFTSSMTATAGVDYNETVSPKMVTLSDTNESGCTNILIMEDELLEGQEHFYVSFQVYDYFGSYTLEGSDSARITIVDSNVAEVGFELPEYTVVEGDETMVMVCVQVFSGELTDVVLLSYSLSLQPHTASENEDYNSAITPGNATLNRNSRRMCHSVLINDDEDSEPRETFSVNIMPTGPSQEFINLFDITVPDTDVSIVDDDSVSISFERTAYTVSEDDLTLEVCLTLDGPLKSDSFVELSISLTSDSATASDDYSSTPIPSTLSLYVDNRRGCIGIRIINDTIVEGTEMFEVRFDETANNQILISGSNDIPVYIQDDETIELQFEQMSYMFLESIASDAVVNIVIANFNQLIIENDVSVAVNINPSATNATENDFRIANGEVLISSGMHSASLNLTLIDDSFVEGVEIITLVMSQGDIIGIDEDAVDSSGKQTIVFLKDDDVVTIGFTETMYTSFEDEAQVCVSLQSGELQTGTVIRYMVATTSTAQPYMEPGMIEESATSQCHSIAVVDDDVVEESEDLQVSLVAVFNVATVLLSPNLTTITVHDDDTLRVGFEMAEYSVEEGRDVIVTIVRENNLQSSQGFSVLLLLKFGSTAIGGEDYSLYDGSTEFTLREGANRTISFGQSEMSKNITVSSVNDNIGEGDEIIFFDLVTDVGNVINVNIGQRDTQITIIEDDSIPVSLTVEQDVINEGEMIMDVCVSINPGSVALLTNGFVNYFLSTSPNTATDEVDFFEPAPNMGTLNQTVRMICSMISTVNDSIVEGEEDFKVQVELEEMYGSFIEATDSSEVQIRILDDDYFQLGYQHSEYTIGEEDGVVNNTVKIMKLNDNILQKDYQLTINVRHSDGPYTAALNSDFHLEGNIPPFVVTFGSADTFIPIPFTLINDEIEEGYENFTLTLSYNEADVDETVQIRTNAANVFIKDDDVVVIGFERSFYIVYEGLETEVCVAVLDRELTNDEERVFTVATGQIADSSYTASADDYTTLQETTRSISRNTVSRHCFTIETTDDEEEEEPERLQIVGTAISHLIEFVPDSAVIWIVDDDSLLLPPPNVAAFNCTPTTTTEETILIWSCTPPQEPPVVELLCAVDCEPLRPCREAEISVADQLNIIVTINAKDYLDGQHTLEIVGLTQTTEIYRTTVKFYGQAEPLELECTSNASESGLIEVKCTPSRALQNVTCSIDGKTPEVCALQFVWKTDDYDKGVHTVVVTATDLLGGRASTTLTFESPQTGALTLLDDREFVAALIIAGAALLIILVLLLIICLLVICYRRKSKHRHENNFVEENMSIQEKNLLELRSVEQADTATQSRSNNEEIETSSKDKSKPQDTETERSYTLRYSHQDPDETSSTQRVPPPTSPKPKKGSGQQQKQDDSMPMLTGASTKLTEQEVQLASIEMDSGRMKVKQSESIAGTEKHTERMELGHGKRRKAVKEHDSVGRETRRVTQSKETTVVVKSHEKIV